MHICSRIYHIQRKFNYHDNNGLLNLCKDIRALVGTNYPELVYIYQTNVVILEHGIVDVLPMMFHWRITNRRHDDIQAFWIYSTFQCCLLWWLQRDHIPLCLEYCVACLRFHGNPDYRHAWWRTSWYAFYVIWISYLHTGMRPCITIKLH